MISCARNYITGVIVPATNTPRRTDQRRGSRLDELELDAWRGFLRTHAVVSRELDAELIADHGVSLSSYEVLLFLADRPTGEMRMTELAQSVLLSRSGLTRLVDRLERHGLVRRESCPGDARGLNAVITDAGRDRFAEARRTHLDGVRRRFLDRLSDDEKRDLGALWRRLGGDGTESPTC
ncbi:MAG: MarR family transcriptional regulator [Thermoleophilaceae bacterium]